MFLAATGGDAEDLVGGSSSQTGGNVKDDRSSRSSSSRDVPGQASPISAAERAERFRVWEDRLKKVISAGPGNADRAVTMVLQRSRSGEPCGVGLPSLSLEEARLRIIRC